MIKPKAAEGKIITNIQVYFREGDKALYDDLVKVSKKTGFSKSAVAYAALLAGYNGARKGLLQFVRKPIRKSRRLEK